MCTYLSICKNKVTDFYRTIVLSFYLLNNKLFFTGYSKLGLVSEMQCKLADFSEQEVHPANFTVQSFTETCCQIKPRLYLLTTPKVPKVCALSFSFCIVKIFYKTILKVLSIFGEKIWKNTTREVISVCYTSLWVFMFC